jgi:hypothetical protein
MLLVNTGIIVGVYIGTRLLGLDNDKKLPIPKLNLKRLKKTPNAHQSEKVVKNDNKSHQPEKC